MCQPILVQAIAARLQPDEDAYRATIKARSSAWAAMMALCLRLAVLRFCKERIRWCHTQFTMGGNRWKGNGGMDMNGREMSTNIPVFTCSQGVGHTLHLPVPPHFEGSIRKAFRTEPIL